MKTIEEAAKEYSATGNYSSDRLSGDRQCFKAGAEFAQRWISAEKELPEPGTMCLVKNESGRILVGKCLETSEWERNFYDLYNVYSKLLIENVSHWRPIELK